MAIFVEAAVALLLSAIMLEVYRGLRRRKTFSQDVMVMDLFLGLGTVAAVVLWFRVLSQALAVQV